MFLEELWKSQSWPPTPHFGPKWPKTAKNEQKKPKVTKNDFLDIQSVHAQNDRNFALILNFRFLFSQNLS